MSEMYYTEDHEWIRVEDGEAFVGITNYAQGKLGDVVFVELPQEGDTCNQGGEVAVVESVKAASDIYSPISGEVIAANEALEDNPALVNEDAEGEAWFYKMTVGDETELEGLMNEEAYKEFCDE